LESPLVNLFEKFCFDVGLKFSNTDFYFKDVLMDKSRKPHEVRNFSSFTKKYGITVKAIIQARNEVDVPFKRLYIAVCTGNRDPDKIHFIIRSNIKTQKLIQIYKAKRASSFEQGIFPPEIKFYHKGKEINQEENFIFVKFTFFKKFKKNEIDNGSVIIAATETEIQKSFLEVVEFHSVFQVFYSFLTCKESTFSHQFESQ
jgi:hypothetical protein